jgi:integrase
MPRKAKELKPVELNRLPPGRHAVGGVTGLLLQIPDPAKPLADGIARTAKTWVLRYCISGKRRDLGLGGYPEVSLSDARDRARKVRTTIFEGRDPIAEKVATRSSAVAAAARAVTFGKAAEQFIADNRAGWRNAKSASQWEATLTTYAASLADLDVADISTSHVLDCLRPIWTTKTETATRVRGRIESVIAYADKKADRERLNPARWKGHLDALLPKPSKVATVEHHAAIGIDAMFAFMQALRKLEGQGARALEYLILTAARSGEVRGATWAEIDLDSAVHVIPAARMKAQREHRVPLSPRAVELLRNQGQGDPEDLLFPGTKGQLSDMTLTACLRRMEIAATAHGFRSTFRDWVSERTAFPGEVAEAALAHAVGDAVEAAYRRGDLFDKRRQLMDAWAQFIDTPPAAGNVTSISAKRA